MNRFPLARAAAIVALALLVAISALLAPARPIAAADTDDLLGTVIDAETKKPIVGALVSVWRDDTPPAPRDGDAPSDRLNWPKQAARSARTDARGAFAFQKEPRAALRWFSVAAAGYAPAALTAPASKVPTSIALERAVVRRDRFLRSTPAGPEPAAGVEIVVLCRPAGAPESLLAARYSTGADGSASLPFGENTRAFLLGPGVATTQFPAQAQPEPVVLPPGGPVSGRVLSPEGAPIAGVSVEVRRTRIDGLRSTSDASGQFRIEGVPCGAPGLYLRVTPPGRPAFTVPVQGGASGLDVVVWPGARVRGLLLDAAGKPVAGAFVRDSDPCEVLEIDNIDLSAPYRSAETSTDGRFELVGVPPGLWTIEARVKRGPRWNATVDVRPGADVIDAPMVLTERATSLPVRVIDHTGSPLGGVEVSIFGREPSVKTATDGTADVPTTTSGIGAVNLGLSGGILGPEPCVAAVSAARALDGRVTIRVCATGTLRVRARGSDGEALPQEVVTYQFAAAEGTDVLVWRGARSAHPRGPSILAPAGRPIRVNASLLGVGSLGVRTCTVDPVKGGDAEFELARPGIVKAIVPAEFPASATRVVAFRPEPSDAFARNRDRFGIEGPDGALVVDELVPGDWTLAYFTVDQPISIVALRRVTIPAIGEVIDLGPLAAPAIVVQGTVRSRGAAVPGAALGVLVGERELTLRTFPDGRYLVRLPAGLDARVVVRSPDHGCVAKPAGSGAAPLDFELGPAATLVLRNCFHDSGFAHPISVRSAGVSTDASASASTGTAVVRGVAPGAVEIVVGEGKSARTIRVDAPAGKTTFVDLATAK